MFKDKPQHNIMGFIICLIACLFFSYSYILSVLPSLMVRPLMETFHATSAQIGFIITFYYYPVFCLQLFAGLIIDRFQVKYSITLAATACTLGIYSLSISHHVYQAELSRLLMGIGGSFGYVCLLTMIKQWLNEKWFTTYMSAFTSSTNFIFMACNYIFIFVLSHTHWQDLSMYITYAGVAITLCCFIFIKKNKKVLSEKSSNLFKLIISSFSLFKHLEWLKIIGIAIFSSITFSTLGATWGIEFLKSTRHITLQQAATPNACLFIGAAIGYIVIGYLADLHKKRKRQLVFVSLIECGLTLILIYVTNMSIISTSILYFIIGFGTGIQINLYYFADKLAPEKIASTALGFVVMAGLLSYITLPPSIGSLLDKFTAGNLTAIQNHVYTPHAFHIVFGIIPIALFIAFLISCTIDPKKYT